MDLNPAQRQILDRLRGDRHDRPGFDSGLRDRLWTAIETGTAAAVATRGPDRPLVVSKNRLSGVHGCEDRFLHDTFAWSVPAAKGRVAHKAIELSLHWDRDAPPLVLVDEALRRLADGENDFGRFLAGLDDAERAELRSEANDRLVKFLECWPRLPPAWRPVTEAAIRQELCEGRLSLRGRVDLTLGAPDGLVAGKVLVDLKTGGTSPAHLEDLRFYGLVETLRLGTPPLRLATYYLDQGRLSVEDVTVALLDAATARLVDGVVKMVELDQREREPVRRAGPGCHWCPLQLDCPEGQAHLEALRHGDPDG